MNKLRQTKGYRSLAFRPQASCYQENWGLAIALTVFLTIFGILPSVTFSQTSTKAPRRESFELKSKAKLVKAYGIISARELPTSSPIETESESSAGTLSSIRRQAELKPLGEERWLVTVNLTAEEFSKDGSVMIVALTNEGKTITSDVRNLSDQRDTETIIGSCGEQTPAKELKDLAALSEKRLKILLRIRQDRYELELEELKERLNKDMIASLQKTEQELNLSYQSPLSAELPLEELAFRIGSIAALLDAKNSLLTN